MGPVTRGKSRSRRSWTAAYLCSAAILVEMERSCKDLTCRDRLLDLGDVLALYFHIMLKPKKPVKVRSDQLGPHLAEVERQFVELWGDMSSWWGVSRTMAEIHGLLYITGQALTAEEIQKRLGISRGNVSMNIRTLVEWGLVRRIRKRGDRRDYFESLADVWEMFTLLATQRKRREIDPVLRTLQQCRDALRPGNLGTLANDSRARDHSRRVEDLLGFLTGMERLAERFFASHRGLQTAFELLGRPAVPEARRARTARAQ